MPFIITLTPQHHLAIFSYTSSYVNYSYIEEFVNS